MQTRAAVDTDVKGCRTSRQVVKEKREGMICNTWYTIAGDRPYTSYPDFQPGTSDRTEWYGRKHDGTFQGKTCTFKS